MAKQKEKVPDQCGNCFFSKAGKASSFDVKIIACRRYPPNQGDRQDRPGNYPFPMLFETAWCGEYKERKTDGKEEE